VGDTSFIETLTCLGRGGPDSYRAVKKLKITVNHVPFKPLPLITKFKADPSTVNAHGTTKLTWHSKHADYCTISNGGHLPANGSKNETLGTTSRTFTLRCYGSGTHVSESVRVTVRPLPVIIKFKANPSTVNAGETTRLTWASAHADYCRLDGGKHIAASGHKDVKMGGSTRQFKIVCYGNGHKDTATVKVTVRSLPQILSFKADPSTVMESDPVTFSWSTKHISSCTLADSAIGFSKKVSANGSYIYKHMPAPSQTFTLTCHGNGHTDKATQKVVVRYYRPVIQSFTATPSSIMDGEDVTLKWTTTHADNCTLSSSQLGFSKRVDVNGSYTYKHVPAPDKTFKLTCKSKGGEVNQSVTVKVNQYKPVINSLKATPPSIMDGEDVTLKWATSHADSCTLSNSALGFSKKVAPDGSYTYQKLPAPDKTFKLACKGDGGTASKTVTVHVSYYKPVIESFTAEPLAVVEKSPVVFSWATKHVNACTLSDSAMGFSKTVGPHGTYTFEHMPPPNQVFTLTCKNKGGEASQSLTIKVNYFPPKIDSFKAKPNPAYANGKVTLSWSTQHTRQCVIKKDGTDVATVDGKGSRKVKMGDSDTTFTLKCSGKGGEASKDVLVKVKFHKPKITKFVAVPNPVAEGGDVKLLWDSEYVQSCVLTNKALQFTKDGLERKGDYTYKRLPAPDQTFTLACKGRGGKTSKSLKLKVWKKPVIVAFSVTPNPVDTGGKAAFVWTTLNAASCTLSSKDGQLDFEETVKPNGKYVKTAVHYGTHVFKLICTGKGGKAHDSIKLKVIPPPPEIEQFSATPARIKAGNPVTFAWKSHNTDICVLSNADLGLEKTLDGTSGSFKFKGMKATNETFQLACMGPGGTATSQAKVVVVPPPRITTFSASPNPIDIGAATTFTWAVTGEPDKCVLSSDTLGFSKNVNKHGGSLSFDDMGTTDAPFTLECKGFGGRDAKHITLTVEKPDITVFSANPTNIEKGGTSSLFWTSTNTTGCYIGTPAFAVAPSGNMSTGVLYSSRRYTLFCQGANNVTAQRSANVIVGEGSGGPVTNNHCVGHIVKRGPAKICVPKQADAPPPTGKPDPVHCWAGANLPGCNDEVKITAFDATPSEVASGKAATLVWGSHGADRCTLSGGRFGSGKSVNAQGSTSSGALNQTTTFNLSCQDKSGNTDSASVAVTVDQGGAKPTLDFSISYGSGGVSRACHIDRRTPGGKTCTNRYQPTDLYQTPPVLSWRATSADQCEITGTISDSGGDSAPGSTTPPQSGASGTYQLALPAPMWDSITDGRSERIAYTFTATCSNEHGEASGEKTFMLRFSKLSNL
jgi:hypothetical protein